MLSLVLVAWFNGGCTALFMVYLWPEIVEFEVWPLIRLFPISATSQRELLGVASVYGSISGAYLGVLPSLIIAGFWFQKYQDRRSKRLPVL
jgi:hypothetical protein